MQKGAAMYSSTSPRRVWDDIGRNALPAIITHLWKEGNKSKTWDTSHSTYTFVGTVHCIGLQAKKLAVLNEY